MNAWEPRESGWFARLGRDGPFNSPVAAMRTCSGTAFSVTTIEKQTERRNSFLINMFVIASKPHPFSIARGCG